MATSTFLARLIGPVLLVMGGALLLDREGYRAMAQEFLASRAMIFLAGLLAFVPGLAIVLTHNVWAADWRVIITLLGWLSLVGGLLRILFPRQLSRIGRSALAGGAVPILASGSAIAALGAILCYRGYLT